MFELVQVLTVLLVSIAMALSLAHALELPGKLRLQKDEYLAMQPIYYPGFTIGGAVGEAGGMIATLLLTLLTPPGSLRFWLTLGAFLALVAMQGVYWWLTHPVNNFWLKDFKLGGLGAGFFGIDPIKRHAGPGPPVWTDLRDRWEYSHVIRACLGFLGLALLVSAVAI